MITVRVYAYRELSSTDVAYVIGVLILAIRDNYTAQVTDVIDVCIGAFGNKAADIAGVITVLVHTF